MIWHPVKSSHIQDVGHDPDTELLMIRFKDGQEYEFPNVNAERFEALRSAKSVGTHFRDNFYKQPKKGG